jgi:chlorobactene glucosyltransferase
VFDALLVAACVPLGVLTAIAVHNLRRAPQMSAAGRPFGTPRVSLLVPARNEAGNLRRTLPALQATDWPNLEILVLDDGSTDATAAVVDAAAAADDRVRRLVGRALPDGWLGKPWACQQLGEAADGDVLIFLDADVLAHPQAVADTVSAMQHRGAGAVTGLPRQTLGSFSERAVVPLVMHLPILATLPLAWSARDLRPASVVANGQWLAFRRDVWTAIGGHRTVADRILEDMELGRAVRRSGQRVVALLAADRLAVRMYDGAAAVFAGFCKNLAGLVGYRGLAALTVAAVWTWLLVLPWVALLAGRVAALPATALVVALAVAVSRQGLAAGVGVAAPLVGSLLVPGLLVASWFRVRFGLARWKGRPLPRQDRSAVSRLIAQGGSRASSGI